MAGFSRRRFAFPFLLCLALFVGLGQLWSLATPLDGAPDERVQIIKAAAVVRGQWIGDPVAGHAGYTVVHVPEVYTTLGTGDCVIGKPTVPVGTCPYRATSAKVVAAQTYVGHYPPLYYLLVGWPTVFATRWSIFLVRLMGTLLDSAFLALAVAAACRWSRSLLLVPALAVAITPAVIFFTGVVNPSGLEMSAGIAMWTSAVILVSNGPKYRHSSGPVAILAVSACVELLVRGDSFIWVPCCAAVIAPMAVGGVTLRPEAIRFSKYVALPALALSAVAAGIWMIVGKPLTVASLGKPAPGSPRAELVRDILGRSEPMVREMIGWFGWLDTPSPWVTYAIWYVIAGAIVMVALLVGRGRHLASLGLAIAAALAVPFVLLNAGIRTSSAIFQGRYFLALAVGVPIVAGCVSTQAGLPRWPAARLSIAVVALACVGQVAAGYWALRRYLVGSNGPLLPIDSVPGVWQPPLPAWFTDAGFVVLWGLLLWLAIRYVLSFGADRKVPVGVGSGGAHLDLHGDQGQARFVE